MNKALIGAVIIAAGLTSTALAQSPKQGVLKVALQRQYMMNTNFTSAKMVWWTKKDKITEKSIIQAIGHVLGHTFSSKAQLIMEEGLLGGFQNPWSDDYSYPHGLTFPRFNYVMGSAAQGVNQVDEGDDEIPGKFQPLGWIFIRDVAASLYTFVDVTPFFNVSVHECYDCFYLNSFITDTTLKFGEVQGPPCCGDDSITSGKGTDKYYMCFEFDNTYMNPRVEDNDEFGLYSQGGEWIRDLEATTIKTLEDGITPNSPAYIDRTMDTKSLRFRVCGIMTYKWALKESQFVGTGTLPASGYGFIKKVCSMLDGKVTVSEYIAGTKSKTPAPSDAFETDWYDMWDWQWRYLFYGEEADYYYSGGGSQ